MRIGGKRCGMLLCERAGSTSRHHDDSDDDHHRVCWWAHSSLRRVAAHFYTFPSLAESLRFRRALFLFFLFARTHARSHAQERRFVLSDAALFTYMGNLSRQCARKNFQFQPSRAAAPAINSDWFIIEHGFNFKRLLFQRALTANAFRYSRS